LSTEDATIAKVMASTPLSVSPEDNIEKAVKLLRDHQYGCLLVTEDDRLVGILSYIDLLDVLLDYLAGSRQVVPA
jgi:acetoin utilization protein AcuB